MRPISKTTLRLPSLTTLKWIVLWTCFMAIITQSSQEDKNNISFVAECKRDFDKLWPPNPPTNKTLILGFLMTMKGNAFTERLGLKIPGMLSKSVEVVNQKRILPDNYTFQIMIKDTLGDLIVSTRHITDMVCGNVTAFIGPENTCDVEATIAEAKNIPMISYACGDKRASERKTFARTNPSEKHLLLATVKTLKHFNWTHYSIVYSNNMRNMADSLEALSVERSITVKHKVSFASENDLPSIFLETMNNTRIYVFIGHRNAVPKALLAMTLRGLFKVDKKEYLVIFVKTEEFYQEDWTSYLYRTDIITDLNIMNETIETDLLTYQGSFMIVGNTLLAENIEEIQKATREYNKKAPFCLSSDVKSALARHVPFLPASYLYDAVQIYARAIQEIYQEQVLAGGNSTIGIDVRSIAENGTAIADKLTNFEFESIMGFNVTMDVDRESKGRYSVYYFTKSEECLQVNKNNRLYPKTHCLIKISDIGESDKLQTNVSIPILAVPVCGFDNDCGNETPEPRKIALVILASVVGLFSIFSILRYRHWKYEQEISGLQWRIEKKELTQIFHPPLNTSKCSIASCVSQELTSQMFYNPVADYRGAYVCLKGINLRRPDLSRETMKHMRSMREIKHRNVCPFIGAYVEVGRLTLVTEYSSRGSLEDVLENDYIKLDELFISSLILDLVRAMIFLHSSFGAHGNLKSTNCVITGRWVLQVTDYDLHDIRMEEYAGLTESDLNGFSPEGKKFLKNQLWRPPELLKIGSEAPGTKEGDIYAFGIILHEIIARKGPFSTSGGEAPSFQVIIEEVIRGYMASGIPRRPNLEDLQNMPFGSDRDVVDVMKMAWLEQKEKRPEFKTIMTKLKRLKKSGNLMDHMVTLLEEHNRNLEGKVHSKTQELREEKKKTEDLLYRMLPPSVVMSLLSNMYVEPQSYDAVTIYFSDIVGFTSLSAESTPYEVVSFLNDLYLEFDTIISCFDVYKVETIGDAYMVVSGLPKRNHGRHAGEIASMALALLEKTTAFKIKHKPDQTLKLRIGLHTGPVVAGVVGRTMPRYCLFGDTVNTASRMESTGEPLRIHISEPCKKALCKLGGYHVDDRGLTQMKGKGLVQTYWLLSADSNAIQPREQPELPMPFFQRFDEFDQERYHRKSPKLAAVENRFNLSNQSPNLASKSFGDPEDNSTPGRERSPSPYDYPRPDMLLPTHQWRRLSSSLRASSLECPRAGLLCPPRASDPTGSTRTASSNSIRESHSLDRFPSNIQLEVPSVKHIKSCSPSSSAPSLPQEEIPKVNFSPSSRVKDEHGNETEVDNESEPMLRLSTVDTDSIHDPDSPNPSNRMKNFFSALRTKGRKEGSCSKLTVNGLNNESHV